MSTRALPAVRAFRPAGAGVSAALVFIAAGQWLAVPSVIANSLAACAAVLGVCVAWSRAKRAGWLGRKRKDPLKPRGRRAVRAR